jgi:large subunit ribosomal protein L17
MAHQRAGKKFGHGQGHRKAIMKGLVRSLVLHEQIKTTEAKAKATRPVAEKIISLGCRAARTLDQGDTPENRAKAVHLRRQAFAFIQDNSVIRKVFDDLASRYKDREGGYTRIFKLGHRVGDAAPISVIQLVV